MMTKRTDSSIHWPLKKQISVMFRWDCTNANSGNRKDDNCGGV